MELKKLPISLIMVVRNCVGQLKETIDYHKDVVSEVIVVDQSSNDGTYEEALQNADLVIKRRCKGVSDPDRNFAFSLGTNPWVLYLDSDEKLSKKTLESLESYITSGADIVWFRRTNLVDGVDIQSITKEDLQSRLFRKGSIQFPDKNHTHANPAPGVNVLYSNGEIIHTRTFEGLKKANRSRNGLYDPEHVQMQEQFIHAVEKLLKENDGFKDNWYSEQQLNDLEDAFHLTKYLKGKVIEIGSWEGKSTCRLANAAFPHDFVYAVDTWAGNIAEGESHPSVVKAKERNVYLEFLTNLEIKTKGNVIPFKVDCFEYLANSVEDVKFCHIDAAHDYDSVKRTIELLKPKLVKGAVLCGDDFQSANASRVDLNGGVERAVRECCPGFYNKGNLWIWVNK